MAIIKRPVYQYQPRNQNPDIAIGIPLPFNKPAASKIDFFRAAAYGDSDNYASGSMDGATVFSQTYTTEEQAMSNFKNLLLTQKGERYMQPDFGTDIKDVLFDNDTKDLRRRLTQTLNKDIDYWLPYINIRNVGVKTPDGGHTLQIRLYFQITTIGANRVINILATENALQVSEVDTDFEMQQVGTVGIGSAFSLGDQGTGAPGVGGTAVGGGGGY
jgi:phage baseplate assembly protein W